MSRRGETVNLHDLGDEGGRGRQANPRDGRDLPAGRAGNLQEGFLQELFQLALGSETQLQLAHLVLHQLRGNLASQTGDAAASGLLQPLGEIGREMGNALHCSQTRPREKGGGRVLAQEP